MDECEHLVPRPLCRQGCAGNKRSGPGESARVDSDAVPDDRKQSDVGEHRIPEPPSKEEPPAGGTKKSASEPSDLLTFKVVNDDVPPADGVRPPGARASEEPIIEGGEPQFDIEDVESTNTPDAERGNPSPQEEIAEKTAAPLRPHKVDISRHLFELFPPAFVKDYPDAQVEIAYADMAGSEKPDAAKNFSVFDLQAAAHFAETKNIAGCNVYVGAALRNAKSNGRANRTDVLTSRHSWADFDEPGDDERVDLLLKEKSVLPAVFVETGRTPHRRFQIYVKLAGNATSKEVAEANAALETWLRGDNVKSPDHLMRLAGTINHPTKGKRKRGYVAELVTLHINLHAPAYTVEQLTSLTSKPRSQFGSDAAKPGRNDDQLRALLEASRMDGHWHNSIRAAIATMVGRGWSDSMIRHVCAPYCKDGYDDPDLQPLIDGARKKWNRPDEELVAHETSIESDLERLNKVHAVLPIGGKTRVVTFGELEEFPGRETIVMTQTIPDFKSLQNKYRHTYRDKKGELRSEPLGTYWIDNQERRQYDGGMAFMPQHDGDVGDKLNLWRGFGVEPIKPDGAVSAAEGCLKFLDFMRTIICSGNEAHFDYLLKREATIFQKRIRTEVALGLQTKEEGCGKGFYEATMGHLLGAHAMQLGNPEHIIGKFNPHLETLLRVTADEALFVGDPKHRNALFGLITEKDLTIEPKNCGIYKAISYLNLSVTSNAEHFLPVSDTARRFFISTVSAARKQDHEYFAGLQAELDNGGYQALLYHLLFEVDLTDFNVRKVPQTEGLRQQRDLGLPPFDAWWCEVLETGTLWGSDPKEPHRAVSNSYTRMEKIETKSRYGDTHTQIRQVKQLGLYDQARQIEPRLRNYTNDHQLGSFLRSMGCDGEKKVLRRRGWAFPPLLKCRAAWEKRYPGWKWRNPEIAEWQPEESDDAMEVVDSDEVAGDRGQMGSKLSAFGFRAFDAFLTALPNQFALELGNTAQDSNHQLAGWGGGVAPALPE